MQSAPSSPFLSSSHRSRQQQQQQQLAVVEMMTMMMGKVMVLRGAWTGLRWRRPFKNSTPPMQQRVTALPLPPHRKEARSRSNRGRGGSAPCYCARRTIQQVTSSASRSCVGWESSASGTIYCSALTRSTQVPTITHIRLHTQPHHPITRFEFNSKEIHANVGYVIA